ncbi:hypothetical protein [Alkalibacter mobilis]|uniref:hypothetical protein n=1 Tax=Alkalibacter mobilis TaxID=2787712 RepID=UPI0018A07CD6|nr:hypothetical protein [Alkalibacter mobilis]MBF7097187.1 hypothetical protein [Alkalibacter mobilis]
MKLYREEWMKILDFLENNDQDFKLFSINYDSEYWFYATALGDSVEISNAKFHEKSCSIPKPRKIGIEEFSMAYPLYKQYTSGVPGIRYKMQKRKIYNSSYIIALIHEIIDDYYYRFSNILQK